VPAAARERQPRESPRAPLLVPVEAPVSNRAAFRAVPVNERTMERIQELHLCTDVSSAGRIASRKRAQGDARQLTKRYPLYGEVPPDVVRVTGGDRSPRTRFVAAASSATSLPLPGLPEVAFAGRSNVGKSSLINALTLSAVARQSDKPGKTQSLNFYSVQDELALVDLPGYGFAFAEEGRMSRWNTLIDDYLGGRGSALKRVLVVLDARHGVKVNDREMLQFLAAAHVKFQVVVNKTDCVTPKDLARRWALITEEVSRLRGAHPQVHMVSTATGAGIAALAADLCRLARAAPVKAAATRLPRAEQLLAEGCQVPRRPTQREVDEQALLGAEEAEKTRNGASAN
jgi:GTP-binding protein